MELRPYQQEAINGLYHWWMRNNALSDCPILVMPTGSGKSLVIAELVRLLFDTWPEDHPRTVVIVPSKELAEQNADKLVKLLPSHLSIGYYSASLGKKVPHADVIVATIGSIAKSAHVLGNIKAVVVDECHLISPDGAGLYRQFLNDLAKYCQFRVVGLTATPFRGNGVWLTDGKAPLFTGIAHEIKVQRLLDEGFLSPLIRPIDEIKTRIDTDDLELSNGDYKLDALDKRVNAYIDQAALEASELAINRRKWIAFTPTVTTAEHLVSALDALGITAALVCGLTPKKEREQLIAEFRAGNIRCLVTVLALATGFDVPDVDCIIWLRPTRSPVLYVQGSGRGLRIAPGKTDCLWLDFSDTTERLGPVDAIRGRKKGRDSNQDAPFAICDNCGAQVRPASLLECPECGAILREPEAKKAREASNAAVMQHQIAPKIVTYDVTDVKYRRHHSRNGGPDSMRVDYWSGLQMVASEWVCLRHEGFARQKALNWWGRFVANTPVTENLNSAVALCFNRAIRPKKITVNETGKYPTIINYTMEQSCL